jgi:tol-pal system protein YbgF
MMREAMDPSPCTGGAKQRGRNAMRRGFQFRMFDRMTDLVGAGAALALALALAIGIAAGPLAAQGAKSGDNAGEMALLQKRVNQLEAQLVDIQVVLGTLETLARSGGGQSAVASGGAAIGGGDDPRIAALETQVRALTAQIQQLSGQPQRAEPQASGQQSGWGQTQSVGSQFGQADPQVGASGSGGFGSTTIQPSSNATIGSLLQRDGNGAGNGGGDARALNGSNAQSEYESAYGLLLQQDYGAAQAAFADFLKRNPKHELAGNAQYWLGETYYVQGQYKSAAGAFLTGYRTYQRSTKAPDSLLKLAMSLDRLGQRAAACSTLSELGAKFPNAPQHVARRVGQEIRRLRC